MRAQLRRVLAALCVAGMLGAAQAQSPFQTVSEALESDGRSMTLPAGPGGIMTVTMCQSCPIKTLHATASSAYFLRNQAVSLTVLRAAIDRNPTAFVTVLYDVKTLDLVSITASIDPPAQQPGAR